MGRDVDYSLARRNVVRDVQRGVLTRGDVCDAHPELLRAAANLGRTSTTACPICAAPELRYVAYAYGDSLKAPGGRVVASAAELRKLGRRHDDLQLYDVEVCLECRWNYMVRTFPGGRRRTG